MSDRALIQQRSTGASSGADAVARAESDVERTRERLTLSMLALRDEVVRKTDWRRLVRRQPAAFLGAAAVLGFLLGYRR
jgi:hypothetical protein